MGEHGYAKILAQIKGQIRTAQIRTVSAANSQMLLLYWQLGNLILENQEQQGWGAKIINMLSADLKKEFPAMKGFSERNLKYMRKFAEQYNLAVLQAYSYIEGELKRSGFSQKKVIKLLQADHRQFVQQAVAQIETVENQHSEIVQQPAAQFQETIFLQAIIARISWSHHLILMDKEPHLGKRLWYMLNSLEHGNSRNILAMQIESGLFERQVTAKKTTNFQNTLPPSSFTNSAMRDLAFAGTLMVNKAIIHSY